MTALAARLRIAAAPGAFLRRHRTTVLAVVAVLAGTVAIDQKDVARAVIGALAMLVFAIVAESNRRLALGIALTWLVFLGFARRLLIPFAGWSSQDPMLLVSPAIAAVLWFFGTRERVHRPTLLSGLGVVLVLWSVVEIANPASPSLLVGLQAALWWVTPFLWFFAGRTLSTDEHEHVLKVALWLGIVVAGFGLYHTFFGLLPFEYTWVGVSGFGASILLPGFRIRPFSTLVSPQEYGYYLSFALTIGWAWLLHRRAYRPWIVAGLAVGVGALFLQGSRQILAFFLLAILVTAILRIRSAGGVLVLCSATAFAFLFVLPAPQPVAPPATAPEQVDGRSTASVIAQHQASGFTAPEQSTAPLHLRLILEGFETSFANPLGVGIGTDSIAARGVEKDGPSPENDVASVFQALGPAGGLVYVAFMVAAFAAAFRAYRRRPSWVHLAWVGLLVAAITQWWSGTLYATSTLFFLALGGLSRPPDPEEAACGS